jgi:hypothetical protein
MTLDLEASVRRANLVTRDEQLEQLFGPDLSPRLLGHIHALKEGRMPESKPIQQTGETTTKENGVPTLPPSRGGPPRRRPVWVVAVATAAFVLAAVGILILALGEEPDAPVATVPAPVEEPVETEEVETVPEEIAVAEAYIEARNAYDAAALGDLLAPGVTFSEVLTNDAGELEGLIEAERVVGFQYSPFSCEPFSREGWVRCTYLADSRFHQIANAPPTEGEFLFAVTDGLLTLVQNNLPFEEWGPIAFEPFTAWLRAEDPDVYEQLYPADRIFPPLTTEAIELHGQYLDLYEDFVRSQNP